MTVRRPLGHAKDGLATRTARKGWEWWSGKHWTCYLFSNTICTCPTYTSSCADVNKNLICIIQECILVHHSNWSQLDMKLSSIRPYDPTSYQNRDVYWTNKRPPVYRPQGWRMLVLKQRLTSEHSANNRNQHIVLCFIPFHGKHYSYTGLQWQFQSGNLVWMIFLAITLCSAF